MQLLVGWRSYTINPDLSLQGMRKRWNNRVFHAECADSYERCREHLLENVNPEEIKEWGHQHGMMCGVHSLKEAPYPVERVYDYWTPDPSGTECNYLGSRATAKPKYTAFCSSWGIVFEGEKGYRAEWVQIDRGFLVRPEPCKNNSHEQMLVLTERNKKLRWLCHQEGEPIEGVTPVLEHVLGHLLRRYGTAELIEENEFNERFRND